MLLHDHTPVVKTIHNSLPLKTNIYTKIRKKYFTDKTIVVSDYQKQILLLSGYADNEVTAIYIGVNTDYFMPIEPCEDIRRKYGIRDNDIVFVSVAGTDLFKGWHLLVEAVAGLDETLRKRVKIVLAGKLPGEETRSKYIDRFGMKNRVIFTGLLSDVRDVVSIADVGFVLSYKIENISYACREMMSMGKPVLVSDYAGLPENIDDGVNGWIAESLNVDLIKERVVEICNSLDRLDLFSVEARKKAEKEFGLTTFIDKTFSCYESVLMSARKLS
jgi:glycosyltransferase involved in cell wall biosynthesis